MLLHVEASDSERKAQQRANCFFNRSEVALHGDILA